MRREWALAREQHEAGSSNPDNLANVRRVAREVLAQVGASNCFALSTSIPKPLT